jgi:pimeloyl-ACP methyl ester carboxylesterase
VLRERATGFARRNLVSRSRKTPGLCERAKPIFTEWPDREGGVDDGRKLKEKEIFVDVGGFSLYARVMGTGKPTVVFESGLGDDLDSWNLVQPAIARLTCTVAYDRAGLGESQPSPGPRNISSMVEELHALLSRAKLTPPYLIVAHSLGGFIARMFTHRYPDQVCGLVLVDPSHEDFQKGMAALRSPEEWSAMEKQRSEHYRSAPVPVRAEVQELQHDLEQMASVTWTGGIPTTILTSTRLEENARRFGMMLEDKALWRRLHAGWLTQVPDAKHILTDQSGHYIQREQPELVIKAIRKMIHAG